jgi:hypothetical protein
LQSTSQQTDQQGKDPYMEQQKLQPSPKHPYYKILTDKELNIVFPTASPVETKQLLAFNVKKGISPFNW